MSITRNHHCPWYNRRHTNVPYGWHSSSWAIFPGPPHRSRYAWSRTVPINSVAFRVSVNSVRHHLAMYLACGLWALLDFQALSCDYGLVIYEGVLEAIEFWIVINGVPKKKRRPVYDMEGLVEVAVPEDSPLLVREALARWKAWMGEWRRLRRGRGEITGGRCPSPSFEGSSDPRMKRWEAFLLPEERRVKPLEESKEQGQDSLGSTQDPH